MASKKCDFKGKVCFEMILCKEGKYSTWELINRLSNYGKTENPIDTRSIGADYIFKQTSPRSVAKLYSKKILFGPFNFYSCVKCRMKIEKVLYQLNMI